MCNISNYDRSYSSLSAGVPMMEILYPSRLINIGRLPTSYMYIIIITQLFNSIMAKLKLLVPYLL